jgi:hypothetical protein
VGFPRGAEQTAREEKVEETNKKWGSFEKRNRRGNEKE